MMEMERVNRGKIQLIADLTHKKLLVSFSLNGLHQIRVPFKQITRILVVNNHIAQNVCVIPLSSPPEFWKRTDDIASTHDSRLRYWNQTSAWFRVTKVGQKTRKTDKLPAKLLTDD